MTALWWQAGVIYQIYPWSFQDSNNDGIGDLSGIERRLDYLVGLGVEAIWISPIYPSPMIDFGYDVSDYCDVDPRFGTLKDFDDLLLQPIAGHLKFCSTLSPITRLTSIHGSWRAALREKTRKGIGTSGAILRLTVDHPITGSAISAALPGHGTTLPDNIFTTPF
jgi:hypothetical protein